MSIWTRTTAATLLLATPALASPNPVPTVSVDPARVAAAKRLVTQLRMEQTLDLMFVQLSPSFAQSVIGSLVTNADTKATVERLIAEGQGGRDRLILILSQEFLASIKRRYPAILDRAVTEYAAAFTLEELTALSDFYAGGAGAKFLRLMPQLQQTMSLAGQEIGRTAGMEAATRGFDRAAREMLPVVAKKAT